MGGTRRILFVLAVLASILIGLKFVLPRNPPSSPNPQPNNQQLITNFPSTFPTPLPTIIPTPKFSRISLDSQELSVETVSSPHEKAQGLSGRNEIGSDGLLFVTDPPQIVVFWMKDMRFSIDILWIKDGKVTGFIENAPVPTSGVEDSKLPTYSSKTPVDYVLELPAGYVKQYRIQAGSAFFSLSP